MKAITDLFVVFLSFSRNQWFALAGGLFVLGTGTVQYMENKAVRMLTEDVNDSVLLSETLSFEFFMKAAGFTSGNGIYTLSRNEALVSLACKALERPDVDTATKAAATWFLTRIFLVAEENQALRSAAELASPTSNDKEIFHPAPSQQPNIITRHLNVPQLAQDFKVQVRDNRYSESMAKIMDLAFQVRPPPGGSEEDIEELAEERRRAIKQSLPLLTCELLEYVSRNRYYHRALVQAGAVDAAVKLMTIVSDAPTADGLLANLSTSPEGRAAILAAEKSHKLLSRIIPSILEDQETEIYRTYDSPIYRNGNQYFPQIRLQSVLANMASSTNESIKAYLLQHNVISQETAESLQDFDLEKAESSRRNVILTTAVVSGTMAAFLYGGFRGVVRNWYRGFGLSYVRAGLESSLRAAIATPILMFTGGALWKYYSKVSDERLFITQAILGSAASLFFLRAVFAVAPFSILPSASAYSRIIAPNRESLRQTRRERITEFRNKSQKPSVVEELED